MQPLPLAAYAHMHMPVFQTLDRASNIDDDEVDEFRRLARAFLDLTAQQVARLIADAELTEVKDDEGA